MGQILTLFISLETKFSLFLFHTYTAQWVLGKLKVLVPFAVLLTFSVACRLALLWRQKRHRDSRRTCRVKVCVRVVLQAETHRRFDKNRNRASLPGTRNAERNRRKRESKLWGCRWEWVGLKDMRAERFSVNHRPFVQVCCLTRLSYLHQRYLKLLWKHCFICLTYEQLFLYADKEDLDWFSQLD